MSQQIQASTPSPVSPAAAPAVTSDQGSTAYPQWVAQTATPAVASVPTAQAPQQVAPALDPSISNLSSQSTSQSSPSNPWEAAMGSLERVISNLPSQSLSQAAPSQLTQAPQQVTTPLSQPSQVQPWAYQEQQVQQTSPTNVSQTQASSPTSTDNSNAELSAASAEVVKQFGIEAPGILNAYACQLEDMLLQQAQKTDAATQRMGGMEQILTNPDYLADYTDRFFTEVVPVDIDSDVPAQAPQQYNQNYDMPAPPAATAGRQQAVQPQQQWDAFGDAMSRSPENAWRMLQNMSPEALRSKLLFMEPS
jgi:hypothetical protein